MKKVKCTVLRTDEYEIYTKGINITIIREDDECEIAVEEIV